jgi:maltose-binding protein MalE
MKTLRLVIVLSLLLVGASTAVFAQDPTPTPAPTATFVPVTEGTLTIWSDAGRLPALEALGAAFTEQYGVPVQIQTMGFGDVRNNLQLAGPVGEGPDIIVGAHDWIGQLYTNGLIQPLELSEAVLANFDPVALRAFTYEGQLVAVPYALEGIALYRNTDLVPEVPATWEETVALAEQLVADGTVERGIAIPNGSGDPYHHYPILTGFGGYIFGVDDAGNYNPDDVGLDQPGSIAAAAEIARLVGADVLNAAVDYGAGESLFHEGQLAMWITGPWALNGIRESGISYAVSAIPTMMETPRPFVGSQGFMINAFSLNALLAQAFLSEFVATDNGMQLLYEAVPFIPAWSPLATTIEDADLAAFASAIAAGDPLPAIPEMNAVWTALGNANALIYQGQAEAEMAYAEAASAIRDEIARAGG